MKSHNINEQHVAGRSVPHACLQLILYISDQDDTENYGTEHESDRSDADDMDEVAITVPPVSNPIQ